MTLKEIRELMVLKEWSRADLAAQLHLSENTIQRWFCKSVANIRRPDYSTSLVMRGWLEEARKEARKVAV